MEIILPFEELSDFIRFKFGHNVRFEYVDSRTVKATYTKLMIRKSIDLQFAEIEPKSLVVRYHAGFLLNSLVQGALNIVMDRMPDLAAGLVSEKGQVQVDLSKIPQTKVLTENLQLGELLVRSDSLFLQLKLKGNDNA